MPILVRVLTWLGYVFGAAVILYGLWRYFVQGSLPSLLISLAVFVAGPLEDILTNWVRRMRQLPDEQLEVTLVDLTTSLAFLILLLIAIAVV
ncbi:MAG: hypothetical protein ACT4PY_03590 [Armatimonadota bacterium]